jgi:hypothetical protein
MNQFNGMLSHRSHYLYHSFIIVLFDIFLMNDRMECSQVPSSHEMHLFRQNEHEDLICWNFHGDSD